MPTTFANTIDGHDIYAKRAECDAAGNDLSTTYATKSELPDGVPAVTSSDNNKVLKASYSGGVASYSWQTESGGGGGGSYTAGTGIDITNDVISVDTSVVATQTDLADKEDVFTVGTGLEMDTSGATPTLQVETPMDIVAGPGIAIDNPDSDTLRVSMAQNYETVLWSGSCLTQGGAAVTLSESASNFEKIEIYAIPNPSNQFNSPQIFTYPGSNTAGAYICPFMTDGLKGKFACGLWTITNGTSFNLVAAGQTDNYPSQNWDNSYGGVVKIVGIHRIANN